MSIETPFSSQFGLRSPFAFADPRESYAVNEFTPALTGDFVNRKYLDGQTRAFSELFTFTGSDGRTYTGSEGQLLTAGLNEPRVGNYIDTGGGLFNAGLLLENEGTNLALQSNGFDNSPWTPTATTVTPNAGTSPDGTNNAYAFSHTGTAAQLQQVVTSTTSIDYTVSVFVKRVDWQWFRIFADTGSVWFDLDSGIKGTSSGPIVSYDIESLGNSWFRVCATVTASSPSFIISLHLAASDGSGTEESGVSAQIYGAQLEEGGLSTSYIPTVATTETRSAEALHIDPVKMAAALGGSMPPALSEAISGCISYVDTDSPSEARFTSWLGVGGFMVNKLNTSGAAVGSVQFRDNDGTTTTQLEDTDVLSPGINIPFSLAARHGSGVDSFNAAVNGSALTAASPAAIADLTAENYEIGSAGYMNINRILIFPSDIADAGIVEATT